MLKQDIHPKIVQERLGHANIAITLDTYSHVAPGLQEAAAKRFDEAFTNKYNDDAEDEAVESVISKISYVYFADGSSALILASNWRLRP